MVGGANLPTLSRKINNNNNMKNVELFWERIGIGTFSFLAGIVFCACLVLPWGEKEIAQERKTAEEIAAEVIIENPDLFLTSDFTEKALKEAGYHRVTATVYNPVVEQCNSNPLLTADCSMIDLNELNSGNLKWVALSRDLLEHFDYGDVIEVRSMSDPSINGIYEVHDTMNRRFKNYIDILRPVGSKKSLGKWTDVVIKKVEG